MRAGRRKQEGTLSCAAAEGLGRGRKMKGPGAVDGQSCGRQVAMLRRVYQDSNSSLNWEMRWDYLASPSTEGVKRES